MIKLLLKLSIIGIVCLLIIGCAKNNVKETTNMDIPTPNQVLIYNFTVNPGDVNNSPDIVTNIKGSTNKTSQTEKAIQLGHEVSDALTNELIQKIANLGLNPVRANQKTVITPEAILITGAFVNIDEGNQLRKSLMGLGLGEASLDSKVKLLTSSASGNQVLISFDVHTDSSDVAKSVNAIKTYKSVCTQQTKNMAEKIIAQLAHYFIRQGWINPGLAQ